LRRELLPLWPDNAAGRRARGSVALAEGRVEEAIQLYTEALELKKVPVDCSYWLAEALRRAGRAAEARPHLERFVAKAPKKSPVLAEARKRLEEEAS
ncbi:MAG TPA: tetratricopeptide repeat protein, partial [Myxococcota bacterium]|nr:tetratricopeptide repeat protein [Myxococcota bacterium]